MPQAQANAPSSPDEIKLINSAFFDMISSTDPGMQKTATDAVNDYTRTKVREDGIYRRVLPMTPVSNDQLTRRVDTDKPVVVVDKEMNSPAAITLPFGSLPKNLYIKGNRYEVHFDRIATPKFSKDVDELRTWIMDIRQVISDNSIKDMLAEEDRKFFSAVDTILVGPNLTVPTSGTVQYETISGGITRDTLWDAMKIMPNTSSNLEVATCVTNHITIKDVCKQNRTEQGGDLAQQIMTDGWTRDTYMGKQWIITIKKNIVPTGTIYMFGNPNFIGKSYSLTDTTMYIRREGPMLEFYAWETIGGAIGHSGGVARADFE